VYGLLRRLTGGHDAIAADVLQESWIRATTRLATFRGDSAFRTWLTGIALNCYREWRRGAAAETEIEDAEQIDTLPSGANTRALEIQQVLDATPRVFREVLVLHDVEGLTHREIASALGIEVGTSKSRLSRARLIFRRAWNRGSTEEHDA
jgi:RNA polymerase sigma-70 factor (ECF subfamily)